MTKEKRTLSPEHIEKLAAGRAAWKENQLASRAVLKADLEKKRAAQEDGRVRTRLMPESSEFSVKAESPKQDTAEEPSIPMVSEPANAVLARQVKKTLVHIDDCVYALDQARSLLESLQK